MKHALLINHDYAMNGQNHLALSLAHRALYLLLMDVERLRTYLLTLPHVAETMQWGANLVFWVGDKAIGGKMFALIDLDEPTGAGAPGLDSETWDSAKPHLILSYSAGPTRYPELLERDGLHPAPYMARIHWVAVERWDAFSDAEWQHELRAAYDLTYAKLPKKVRATLALPITQQRRLIAEARRKQVKKS